MGTQCFAYGAGQRAELVGFAKDRDSGVGSVCGSSVPTGQQDGDVGIFLPDLARERHLRMRTAALSLGVEKVAKEKLRDGGLSLSDVALTCGFANQSHLTRVFTRMVGVSPGAWRRALG